MELLGEHPQAPSMAVLWGTRDDLHHAVHQTSRLVVGVKLLNSTYQIASHRKILSSESPYRV
ncbi:MAG: hypothetical protein ACI855_003994, partial [Myxococcota bacterium]